MNPPRCRSVRGGDAPDDDQGEAGESVWHGLEGKRVMAPDGSRDNPR